MEASESGGLEDLDGILKLLSAKPEESSTEFATSTASCTSSDSSFSLPIPSTPTAFEHLLSSRPQASRSQLSSSSPEAASLQALRRELELLDDPIEYTQEVKNLYFPSQASSSGYMGNSFNRMHSQYVMPPRFGLPSSFASGFGVINNGNHMLDSLSDFLFSDNASRLNTTGLVTNNIPGTSNSSMSSSSSDEQMDNKRKSTDGSGFDGIESSPPQSKSRRRGKKRDHQPRYAIQTKSDKEIMDDGYRWRKYGQKAVKNSPYPRSYYRCTYTKCHVKKRVERSCKDPSLVITTYEGVHTHHSPATIRTSAESQYMNCMAFSRALYPNLHVHPPMQQLQLPGTTHVLNTGAGFIGNEGASLNAGSMSGPESIDRGLLEDMLPMRSC